MSKGSWARPANKKKYDNGFKRIRWGGKGYNKKGKIIENKRKRD